MKDWWNKKQEKRRKRRKNDDEYTFKDFLFDTLLWAPEVILFPFRLIFWLVRGLYRFLVDMA